MKKSGKVKKSSGMVSKAKRSRVQAQSLLIGDEFIMNGVPNATVTKYSRGSKETSFVLKIPGKKKSITKTLENTKKVLINDYPQSSAKRKQLSRMPAKQRFVADNRKLDA
jgi:hypothetical protein